MQSAFKTTVAHFDHAAHTASVLIQGGAIFGIPLVVSEQYPEKLGHTVLDVTTARAVYPKTTFSMINDSFPREMLQTRETFILFGIEAHVCILQTALDLLANQKSVVLVTDAISSSRTLDRSTAFHRLASAGAVLMTAESILFELAKSKDAPEFKDVSALAKRIASYSRDNQVMSSL